MSTFNDVLLNSLIWNLQEISKLELKLQGKIGCINCTSWRFPMKNSEDLNAMEILRESKQDQYTLALELTYDRSVYVLLLLVKYLDTIIEQPDTRKQRNIKPPQSPSFTSVLYMIWDRFKKLNVKVGTLEEIGQQWALKRESTASQTDATCISTCVCCAIAQKLFTHLILEIERVFTGENIESAVALERKNGKARLADMSNWSAMNRWVGAIMEDLQVIIVNAEKLKSQNENRKVQETSRDKKRKKQEKTIEELNGVIRNLKQQNSTLERSLEKEITETAEKIRIYESNFESRRIEVINLERTIDEERQAKKDVETKLMKDQDNLFCLVQKLQEENEKNKREFKEKLTSTSNDTKLVELELERRTKECGDLAKTLQEKESVITDYKKKILESYPALDKGKQEYKASGDPVVDMKNQKLANLLRIEQLHADNQQLDTTIAKLKERQTRESITTRHPPTCNNRSPSGVH